MDARLYPDLGNTTQSMVIGIKQLATITTSPELAVATTDLRYSNIKIRVEGTLLDRSNSEIVSNPMITLPTPGIASLHQGFAIRTRSRSIGNKQHATTTTSTSLAVAETLLQRSK